MHKVLFVGDNFLFQKSLKNMLDKKGYSTFCLGNYENIILHVEKSRPDLIILEDKPSGSDGFEACALLKEDPRTTHIPLIFLTEAERLENKILGFKLGASDYITNNCNHLELMARIESKIKNNIYDKNVIVVGNLQINTDTQNVSYISKGQSKDIFLSFLEYKILVYFVKNKDRSISRDMLLDNVWGESNYVTDRTVDVHISSLRKKCPEIGKYIKTIYGYGYKFSVQ